MEGEELQQRTPEPATHRVFFFKREGPNSPCWVEIGGAFKHDDGLGFDVLLKSLPTEFDGHLHVRAEGAELPVFARKKL